MAKWKIPLIEIGDMKVKLIQGGMGVGISGSSLASAVANQGGLGVIASVGLGGANTPARDYVESSNQALRREIRSAREKITGSGYLGVNIMHALTNYQDLVQVSLEENVDAIISGAGIPRDLPTLAKTAGNTHTKLIPIVSSARLADMLCSSWKRQEHLPDAIIVEGPKAGGHLGYSHQQLADIEFVNQGLETIIPEVVQAVKPYETSTQKIPVIAAGGIYYGNDIKKFLKLGASGVQIATRLVTTPECDADIRFKQIYLNCKKGDIIIIHSPVGMPGRAINNKFLEEVDKGKKHPINCPYHCLKTCKPKESPYCIARALIEAKDGEFENGYVFCGSNAYLCRKIVSVEQVFNELNREYSEWLITRGVRRFLEKFAD